MPVSLPNIFRALVLLLMAGYAFSMYCMARSMGETVGFRWTTIIVTSAWVLALMIPLAWAVGLPELPELYQWLHRQRRWKTGRCPRCGYDLRGGSGGTCPECAETTEKPEPYSFTWRTVVRFAAMIVLAWMLGSAAGESWTRYDERLFEQEVEARLASGVNGRYARPRRWPSETAGLVYVPGHGIQAHD
jgi:hypothetical protein